MQISKQTFRFIAAAFIVMLAGLLWSRAVLSVSNILWLALVCTAFSKSKQVLREPMMLWSLAPIVLFVFGAYQQPFNTGTYDYLLTWLVYPLAMLAGFYLQLHKIDFLKQVWIVAGLISLFYPVGWYLLHMAQAHTAYAQGGSLPTFMDTDHVRYGIFLNSVLLLTMYVKEISDSLRSVIAVGLIIIIAWMSVRTAWIALGIVILFGAFMPGAERIKKICRWMLVMISPAFALAYLFVPTVKQKINYTIYDYSSFDSNHYDSNFSDGTRRAINSVAWKTIKGGRTAVGWAQVPSTLQQQFAKQYHQTPGYGWPFNQWLFWWIGSGLAGVLLFSLWLLYPAYYGFRNNHLPLACWTLVIAASCMVECTLNLQYGVFLHVWPIVLLWRNKHESATANS